MDPTDTPSQPPHPPRHLPGNPIVQNLDGLLLQSNWVRSLALHLARDASEADDLAQATWLAALSSPESKWPRTGWKPWLRGILRREAAFLRRGSARRRDREREAAQSEALPSTAALVARGEAHRRMVEALLGLEEPARGLLLLRHFEGLTPGQIAQRRGLPASTVRGQLQRARAALAERIGPKDSFWGAWAPLALARSPWAPAPASAAGLTTLTMKKLAILLIAALAAMLTLDPFDLNVLGLQESPGVVGVEGAPLDPLGPEMEGVPGHRELAEAPEEATQGTPGASEQAAATVQKPRSKIHGRLVEDSTGEPLPGYRMGFHHTGISSTDGLDQDVRVNAPEEVFFEPKYETGADGSLQLQFFDTYSEHIESETEGEYRDPRPLYNIPSFFGPQGHRTEELVTDSEGRFETTRRYPAGTFALYMLDGGPDAHNVYSMGDSALETAAPLRVLEWTEDSEGVNVSIQSGATFTLEIEDTSIQAWESLTVQARVAQSVPGSARAIEYSLAGRMLEGDEPRIRFTQSYLWLISMGGEIVVELSNRDKDWQGKGFLPRSLGVHSAPVVIRGHRPAQVEFEFSHALDRSRVYPDIEFVTLRCLDPSLADPVPRQVYGREDARYAFDNLPAGLYRMRAKYPGTSPVTLDFDLAPGDLVRREIVLTPYAKPSLVEGSLTSTSQQFKSEITVELQNADTGESLFLHPKWLESSEGWRAPFRFDPVPEGKHRIYVHAFGESTQHLRWEGEGREVTAPGAPVELLVRDELPTREVTFAVSDRSTGLVIENHGVELRIQGRLRRTEPTWVTPGVTRCTVTEGTEGQWVVSAPGYLDARGDLSEAALEGETLDIVVHLEPVD